MNRSSLRFACSVAVAMCCGTAPLHADEAIATKDVTVQNLADSLYKPGYANFLATRDRLRMIAEQGPKGQAEEATQVLREYAENADRWLFDVGNTEEWKLPNAAELPLGQGRIGGGKGSKVLILAKKRISSGDMAYLYSYGPLKMVGMMGETFTDEHLRYLSGFNEMELLEIEDANVSGSFLADVDLPSLECLHIANSPVCDESLPKDALRRLTTADFCGTLITNATIRRLSIEDLEVLKVSNTAVNADGVMMLNPNYSCALLRQPPKSVL